jgi:hypothetical protein
METGNIRLYLENMVVLSVGLTIVGLLPISGKICLYSNNITP